MQGWRGCWSGRRRRSEEGKARQGKAEFTRKARRRKKHEGHEEEKAKKMVLNVNQTHDVQKTGLDELAVSRAFLRDLRGFFFFVPSW
jgi:hypothetical protein